MVPLTPGSSLHEIFPERMQEWVVIFSSPRDFPNPGMEPVYHALAGGFFPTEPPGKPHSGGIIIVILIIH